MTEYTLPDLVAEIERTTHVMQHPRAVFVFGSNEGGVHGRGAALAALREYGARMGCGVGPSGRSYAIPTKDKRLRTLPLNIIGGHVAEFLRFARDNPLFPFAVTRVGCGLAGYDDAEIAPFFADAPVNCHLPPGWRRG